MKEDEQDNEESQEELEEASTDVPSDEGKEDFDSRFEPDFQEDSMNMGSVIPSRAPVLESTPIDEPIQNLEQEMKEIPSSSSSESEQPFYAEQSSIYSGGYSELNYEQPQGDSMQRDRGIAIRPSLNNQESSQHPGINLRKFQQQSLGSGRSMRDREREYAESNRGQGTKSKNIFGRERAF